MTSLRWTSGIPFTSYPKGTCGAHLVILAALGRITQDRIGFAYLFEPFSSLLITPVYVGMVLLGKFTETLLNLFSSCFLVDSEYLVEIFPGRRHVPQTLLVVLVDTHPSWSDEDAL
jgi:hypothetical protein